MRRTVVAVLSTLLALGAAVAAPGSAAAAAGPFTGTWTSTDLDGSNQWVSIRGSGSGAYSVFLYDDSATNACGGDPARFVGAGRADGAFLDVPGTLTCLPGGNVIRHRIGFGFELVDDTLVDVSGVVWSRA
ncbi:hypothetical protein [Oryzobacter telluris]|uniref:hypothetical protein n=1 Tax=Oryzobacter telluris TaxID=3149179 RepID=UPI00370D174D